MKTTLILSMLAGMTFQSCIVSQDAIVPSENYLTKQVNVAAFDGIRTSTAIDVVYTQADRTAVEIYAPDNLMEYVKVESRDGLLNVYFESDEAGKSLNIRGNHKTKVRVSAPAVHTLQASSSGDIVLANGLKTDGCVRIESSSSGDIEGADISCEELKIQASSAGDIELERVECSSLHAEASSSGDVSVSGVARSAKFEASSAGDIDADELKAEEVTAKASSAGDVSCHAVASLEASTSSAGNVRYKGNPKDIRIHSKGVQKID